MSVWYCIPSARPAAEAEKCLSAWRELGYRLAVWVEFAPGSGRAFPICEHQILSMIPYPGYAVAVNTLIREVLARDLDAEWIVTGGDDTWPDQQFMPWQIANQLREHFNGTFGVMQPTGDRFADGAIDWFAGSPWIGREFCERMYGGKGPYWPEYTHCFVDKELQMVAKKLGVFWQRPDLVHLHRHYSRLSDDLNSDAVRRPAPQHLKEAASDDHFRKYYDIFKAREYSGFPGHEPL